jgi:flagellar protein FliO/FliZ
MDFLFGADMPLAVRFFFAFIIVLALIGGTALLVRRFGGERMGASSSRGRQPRLAVIDAAAVDGRRRLILIRRDNVEHLLMIGGPSDVVVEANIVRAAQARDAGSRPEALPRAVAANEGSMWPLQPEPAPTPRPPRQQPAMEDPMAMPMQWHDADEPPPLPPRRPEPRPEPRADPRVDMRAEPRAEMRPEPRADARPEPRPDIRAEPRPDMRPEPRVDMRPEPRPEMRPEPRPEMRPEPRPEPRTADPLAGLAAELARVQPEPSAPKPRPQPREVPRARGPQPLRPAAPPPADEPSPAPNSDQNLAEMAQRLEAALRRPKPVEPRGPEPASKQPMMPPEPMAEPPSRAAANEPQRDDRPAPAPQRAAAAAPKPQKSVYDSLEQEMASLLGRPNSKA